jgi:DNA-binding NarL/FixJ family response regulator
LASEPQHLVKYVLRGEGLPVRSVLIVDDNSLIRQMLCELFVREGDFDVCGQAENGQEAVEKAQLLHPDLIVTDLSMPVMNGLEETRVLKKLMPRIPVIIFTAHSDSSVEREAIAAGVSAVVSKSQAVAVLTETARSLLEQIAA